MKVIVIDGVIGVGKTEYISLLREKLSISGTKFKIIVEPVDKWKENGMLAAFYKDQKKYAYLFQTQAFHDRIMENVESYNPSENIELYILERSWFTDKIFMDMLYESGTVNTLEYQSYQKWWHFWKKLVPYKPSAFLYLTAPLNICMDRISARDRDGEKSGVSNDYEKRLSEHHEEFFKDPLVDIGDEKVPCFRIDTTLNFKDDEGVKDSTFAKFQEILTRL